MIFLWDLHEKIKTALNCDVNIMILAVYKNWK